MSHNFPCSPQGGKVSQLNPTCCMGKSILGGICMHIVRITSMKQLGIQVCSVPHMVYISSLHGDSQTFMDYTLIVSK